MSHIVEKEMSHIVEVDLGGRTISLETGRVAKQANGAVVVRSALARGRLRDARVLLPLEHAGPGAVSVVLAQSPPVCRRAVFL